MSLLNLDSMPLDSRENVLSAWRLVHSSAVRGTVSPGDLARAKDRIQYAAIEFGMGLFLEAEIGPHPENRIMCPRCGQIYIIPCGWTIDPGTICASCQVEIREPSGPGT